MSKQIYVFNKQYESLIDTIKEVDGKFIIRTTDNRFFNFGERSVKLLLDVESGRINDQDRQVIVDFVNSALLANGIYQPWGVAGTYQKRKPVLAAHKTLIHQHYTNIISRLLTWLFLRRFMIPLTVGAIAIHILYLWTHTYIFSYDFIFTYTIQDLIFLIPIALACSLFHEFGHASACKNYAGKTGEIGLGINIIFPVFFANVSNVYLLKRTEKAIVSLSGVYFQALFGLVIIGLATRFPALDKFITLHIFSLIFTLLPFFRNDGYWFLNDILKKRDLLAESYRNITTRKNVEAVHVLYTVFFMLFTGAIIFSLTRFILYRGPQMVVGFFEKEYLDFSAYLKFTLVMVHYIVIIFCMYFVCCKIFRFLSKGYR